MDSRGEGVWQAIGQELSRDFVAGSMHRDIFPAPPVSTWLAGSDLYQHQAFRVGGCAWGAQFHPEISPQTYQRWAEKLASDDPDEMGRVKEGIDHVWASDAESIAWTETLASRFPEIVLAQAFSSVGGGGRSA